jgi:hypothetical protein
MDDPHPMQAMVDGMNAAWQKERSESEQMTLGELIAALEAMPEGAMVANLYGGDSYRGYYVDFAFARGEGTRPAADLLAECKAAMGQVFEGYKGGDYVMGATTPVWVADYGDTGPKLMAIHAGGEIETAEDD